MTDATIGKAELQALRDTDCGIRFVGDTVSSVGAIGCAVARPKGPAQLPKALPGYADLTD